MPRTISKSKYCIGLQCPKLLWVNFNDRERLPAVDAAVQARFDQGHEIGELANSLYPDGVDVVFRPGETQRMIEETVAAVAARKLVFEATFVDDGMYAQADILVPVEDNAWDVIEVKSGTAVKPVNIDDLAFQKHCYESAGLNIRSCFLMHVNNQYVRQGEVDPAQLLIKEDITDQVIERQRFVPANLERMRETIADPFCPDIQVGFHCSDPYPCPLHDECWGFLPKHNVTTLYRTPLKKTLPMIRSGVCDLRDLPHDYPLGNRAEIQRMAVLYDTPQINLDGIREFLDGLRFPQYHLDFETYQMAIPPFDGMRPYCQIPFQFSLHIWRSFDSEPEHIEFLADGTDDPRPALLEALRENIGPGGDIIVYNQAFEIGRLRECAEAFPEYRMFVKDACARIKDLLVPFRKFLYYHPDQLGSASIKKVLPVLVPELSYAEMEIGDGGTASSEYVRVTFGEVEETDRHRVRQALLKYCELDTLAMIRIIQALIDHVT
jgi:hypothetical protein